MIPALRGNWVDLIIIIVLVYFATEAWRHGFWVIIVDFLSFLGALAISLATYKFTSDFLKDNFNISHSLANEIAQHRFGNTIVGNNSVLHWAVGDDALRGLADHVLCFKTDC